MKLLQVNTVYKEKSTGRTTYELEQYLEKKGWECYAAYSDGPDKKDKDHFIRLGGLNAHRIHCRLARWFDLQGFFSPISAHRLINYIKKTQPDIVHLRNLHDNYLSIIPVIQYLEKEKIPTVVTLHDFFLFTGGCCFNVDYDCDKWITGQCKDCPQAKRESIVDCSSYVQRKKLEVFSGMDKLSVVGVSEWATNEFVKSNNLPKAHTKTIYNWIDFKIFKPANVDKKDVFGEYVKDKFVIVGVATYWNDIKGLDDFIKLSEMIGEDCVIVLIGNVPKMELPKNIITLGTIKNTEKLAVCYAAADVFVSFSARETFGKVIAEAMSCGCPAVVYDVTACGELVKDGGGYAVPLGDVDKALKCINKIKTDGKDIYQKSCMNNTRKKFDLETNAEQYDLLYRSMINDDKQ